MKREPHIPRVHADEVYEANYAMRKRIADESARELAEAITACGPGAEDYGRHHIHDKLGLEATRVIYCRRDGGVWSITHLPRRYDVSTAVIDSSYRPRTPAQAKAAAEARRAKAIAEIEEAERVRRETPQFDLFGGAT